MAQEYWIVIAKGTNIGDVEVWYGDFDDCELFYEVNKGILNGAPLEIVPDVFMNDLAQEEDPEESVQEIEAELGYDSRVMDEVRELVRLMEIELTL